MLTYYILLSFAVLPALLFRNKMGLLFSLLFVCAMCSIRYGQGDYFAYLHYFEITQNFSIAEYANTTTSWKQFLLQRHPLLNIEFGYFLLEQVFIPLGFELFVAFSTFFFFAATFCFIKEFVHPRYYWLALILFYNPIISICFLSAIRQSFACAFLAFALIALSRGYKLKSVILLILLGASFHASCIFMFGLIPLYKMNFKKIAIGAIIVGLSLPLLAVFIRYLVVFVGYGHYLETSHSSSPLYSFAICSLLISGIFFMKVSNHQTAMLATLALGLVFARLVSTVMPEMFFINRIGMYFEFSTIAFFPAVLQYRKNDMSKLLIVALLLFLAIRTYFFFDHPTWIGNKKFYYSTIFNKEAFGE